MPTSPLFRWGVPEGWVATSALALGILCLLVPAPSRRLLLARRRLWLCGLAAAAALSSLGYAHFYLGDAPRIIDATAYLLEGRLLAAGSFTFVPPEPSALFRGRFLIQPDNLPLRLGVIFPPGYPLLLALGELVASYKIVGPCLAFGLVWVTALLAHDITRSWRAALLAGTFSLLSACLRYQTADTMSHGWSALLAVSLVLVCLRLARSARQPSDRAQRAAPLPLAAGASVGFLICTRELTGLVFGCVCLGFLVLRGALDRRSWCLVAIGSVPALGVLLWHHHALTGEFFGSPQLRYYALSDGPPGCFGLGLGKGCAFEHPEVVRVQGGGLTLWWALRNTLNRLHAHCLDIANFEPLALVALWWMIKRRQLAHGRLFLMLLAALPLAYASFYFDGSYPGGGGRFLSELLPIEHVALGAAFLSLGRARFGLALALLGFAVHGSFSHAHVGARPEGAGPAIPAALGPSLVFVESDHVFLGQFKPNALPLTPGGPPRAPLVVRRGDALRERFLWERLGRPSSYRFRNGAATPVTWPEPPSGSEPFVLEMESEWPVLAEHGLWAHPAYAPGSCVSAGRSLLLHPSTPGRAGTPHLTVEASGVPRGRYRVRAVYWSAESECFAEDLADQELPGRVEVHLKRALLASRHLDRLEFTRVR